MSQFRTTADLCDKVLKRCGEPTNGNSAYEADVLEYLNKIQQTVVAGGNIFDVEVDEAWVWAKAKNPIVLTLEPAITTGTVAFVIGSEAITFSSGPAASVAGWFLKIDNEKEVYKIATHTAASTAAELTSPYLGTTGSKNYKIFKLDYEIYPQYFTIDSSNNKLDFKEASAGSQITGTLTAGSYTAADLATHVGTVLTGTAGVGTYTSSFDTLTRKFTITQSVAGGATAFQLLGATGTNQDRNALPLLGFDDSDATGALAYTAAYCTGGISRLVEPFQYFNFSGREAFVYGVDPLTFVKDHPLVDTVQSLPCSFTKINEDPHGKITVRFDSYPLNKEMLTIDWIPVPRDLKDNTASVPIIPRKYSDILEFGASFFILLDKEDTKADAFQVLARAQLASMKKHNRAEEFRTGKDFGRIVPRRDNYPNHKGPRIGGYENN